MVDGWILENHASRHVYVVDDEPKVCGALSRILEGVGMRVSCFGDAEDCLARLGAETCDLLITDVRMPGKNGMELLLEVRRRKPWLPVFLMTGFGDVPMAVEALKAGAADFIEKPLDRDVFLDRVWGLVARHTVVTRPQDCSLTEMEAKVLQHILEGSNNRKIADMLHRSPRTIEVHRRHLMRKFGVTNVVELLRRASAFRLPSQAAHASKSTRRAIDA